MPDQLYEELAANVADINTRIVEAEQLLSLGRDAGLDVATRESELRGLKIQRDKWAKALQQRGIVVPQ